MQKRLREILIVDNYDSFTHNVAALVSSASQVPCRVVRAKEGAALIEAPGILSFSVLDLQPLKHILNCSIALHGCLMTLQPWASVWACKHLHIFMVAVWHCWNVLGMANFEP